MCDSGYPPSRLQKLVGEIAEKVLKTNFSNNHTEFEDELEWFGRSRQTEPAGLLIKALQFGFSTDVLNSLLHENPGKTKYLCNATLPN